MTLTTPPNQPRDLEKSVMTFGTRDKRERPRKRPLPPETQMAKEEIMTYVFQWPGRDKDRKGG